MPFDKQAYTQHPLSSAWPAMSAGDFDALCEDIRRVGLRDPITLYEDMILDGWHRFNACLCVNVAPEFVEFSEGDPAEFSVSKNGHRRHLTEVQRARGLVACADWKPTGRPKGGSPAAFSSAQMAAAAHVSERTIRNVKAGEKAGFGELMRDGKVSAEKAAELSKAPPEIQAQAKEALKKGEAPKLPEKARPISELEKLQIENEELKDSLAEMARDLEAYMKVEAADGKVDSTIADMLRQQRAIESQRDSLMRENAELKKEVKRLQRKLGMKA